MAAVRAWLAALPISILIVLVGLLPFAGSQQYSMRCAYFLSPKELAANSVIKSIKIPVVFGVYEPLQNCEWRISTSDPNMVVRVIVERLSIEGSDYYGICSNDYIDLYEEKHGSVITLGRLCGSGMQGKTFESSSSEMTITFVSNINYEFSGFHLSYLAVSKETYKSGPDVKTELAVSIPIVVIGLCMFIGVLVYVWHRRRVKNRTARDQQADPSTRQPGQGDILSESTPSYAEVMQQSSRQYPQTQTQTRSSYHEGAASWRDNDLQVSLPNSSSAPLRGRSIDIDRSPTPPPSYEYLVRHEGLLDQQNSGISLCPPDYETVVKETLSPPQRTEMDSQV